MKKIISLLLTVVLLVTMTTGITTTVFAADGDITYLYCDANGANWQTGTKAAGEYTLVTASDTAWGTSGSETWYVASGEITIDSRVTVTGDVHLILADGCKLTVSSGINVSGGNKFTIYGQSAGTGELNAGASTQSAAIGGNQWGTTGTITINGGIITATGDEFAAGIGGGRSNQSGDSGSGGIITINGGTVKAYGSNGSFGGTGGAGIGGGCYGNGGIITITGGTITATGGNRAAGIGDGSGASGGSFSTGTDGNAVIVALSISDTTNQDSWNGIINYTMNGDTVTPTEDFEIPAGTTLTIANGQTLTVAEGITLTNNGTIVIEEGGQLIVNGTLINNGTITNKGAITNNGTGTCGANNHVMSADGKCLICGCYVTTITYSVEPTYTVTIPATVELGKTATISAENVVIEKGTQVEVSLTGTSEDDNTFKLKTQEGAELSYTVKNADADVAVGDTVLTVNPDNSASGETTLSFIPPTGDIQFAGEYTGTVTFTVSVEAAS